MRIFLSILLVCLPSVAMANAYFGLNGNYSFFSSPELKDHKVSAKGSGYGAILGIGKDFVGLEGFYQTLNTQGEIKHEGEKAKIDMNAQAYGLALRFSFQSFFLRLGAGRYNLDQSVDISDATNRRAAEDIYNIQDKGTTKNGVLFGIGVHAKFAIGRLYLDYTRHQIASIGAYDSLGIGLSWIIPDSILAVGKN